MPLKRENEVIIWDLATCFYWPDPSIWSRVCAPSYQCSLAMPRLGMLVSMGDPWNHGWLGLKSASGKIYTIVNLHGRQGKVGHVFVSFSLKELCCSLAKHTRICGKDHILCFHCRETCSPATSGALGCDSVSLPLPPSRDFRFQVFLSIFAIRFFAWWHLNSHWISLQNGALKSLTVCPMLSSSPFSTGIIVTLPTVIFLGGSQSIVLICHLLSRNSISNNIYI